MNNIRIKLFIIITLFSFKASGQSEACDEKAKEVFNKIIFSIGNSFPPPPNLKIIKSEFSVAYSDGKDIYIENKLINSLCGDENFESKISYIISHELAHHYLNHTWMFNTGFAYSSSLGELLDEKMNSYEQRKLSEVQADLFGGFFGQISGYESLKNAVDVLSQVYKEYNLSSEIKGYPSLDERVSIISSNIENIEHLELLFNLGNILQLLGEYETSIKAFNDILGNNFTSREIYNNQGLNYLMSIISISPKKLQEYNFPISLDLNTRASISKTRDIKGLKDLNYLFDKSYELLNQSIKLDPAYYPAKQNLAVLDYLNNILINNSDPFKHLNKYNIGEKKVNDLKVIDHLINNRNDLALETAKMASDISKENLANFKQEYSNDYSYLLKELNISIKDFLFGFENNTKIRSINGDILINKASFEDFEILEIDNLFIISTTRDLNNDKNYEVINYKGKNIFLVKV